MKPRTIFGLLTLAIGLLGGSFTHAAIAHSIPSEQTSPVLIATAYTDLTLPTLRQGDRGRNVQLLQRILQDNLVVPSIPHKDWSIAKMIQKIRCATQPFLLLR